MNRVIQDGIMFDVHYVNGTQVLVQWRGRSSPGMLSTKKSVRLVKVGMNEFTITNEPIYRAKLWIVHKGMIRQNEAKTLKQAIAYCGTRGNL